MISRCKEEEHSVQEKESIPDSKMSNKIQHKHSLNPKQVTTLLSDNLPEVITAHLIVQKDRTIILENTWIVDFSDKS